MATARLARFLIISACISVAVQTAAGSTESGSILDEGMKLYKAGQYSKAAFKFLDAAKKEKGKEPAAYYYLGCCYFNLKRPNDAKALFRTIISSYPASKEAALSSTMLQRIDPAPATGGSASSATDSGGAGAGKTIVMRSTSSRFSKDDSAALQKEMATLPDVVRFPFTSDPSGHMRVTAYLNDRPVEAWFDTGASAHFGKNHLKQASIPEPRGPTTDKTSGWAGEEVPVWKMSATLKIGNLTRKVPVTVEENMESTPLVGQEIIKGYQCEVDNSSHYITLRKSKT